MKKKLLVFIGLITFVMCFMLVVPKAKALTLYEDYNAMVIGWDSSQEVYITYFDLDGTFNVLVDIDNILDNAGIDPILYGYEFIEGIKLKLTIISLTPFIAHGEIVVEQPDFKIYNLNNMVGGQVYEYKGIVNNTYIFQQGFNFYQVLMTQVSVFRHDKEGEYNFETILKPGNKYMFITDFGDVRFYFFGSPDFDYYKGFQDGQAMSSEQSYNAYRNGYEAGMRVAEGLLESEYQRGRQNGYASGYDGGLNKGYQAGFNDAYSEIISSDEYTLGYDNGFKAGEKSKIAQNNQSFYSGIEKWLVPAIIVVLVVGGIMSISALKRSEQ